MLFLYGSCSETEVSEQLYSLKSVYLENARWLVFVKTGLKKRVFQV